MSEPADPLAEVQRWSDRLRAEIRAHRHTLASADRGLAHGHGYLKQLLRPGPPELRVRQVLEILAFLGVPWEEFFRGLYPGGVDARAAEAIARLIEERAQAAARAAVAEALPPAG